MTSAARRSSATAWSRPPASSARIPTAAARSPPGARRSEIFQNRRLRGSRNGEPHDLGGGGRLRVGGAADVALPGQRPRLLRSEEHTSELQSQSNLVCRLLLE